jgi:endonuclease/exonuclease/phosphatase family metal-dependent hydrolase
MIRIRLQFTLFMFYSIILSILLLLAACRGESASSGNQVPELPPRREIRLLTYNVFGEIAPSKQRMRALFTEMRKADADIIALQEAEPWIIKRLLLEPWVEKLHHPSISWTNTQRGGLYMLSRFPIVDSSYSELPSIMGRGIMTITVVMEGRRLKAGTIHLESFLTAHEMRAAQLDACFALMQTGSDDAVLLGDFNFGDYDRLENSRIPQLWVDVWKALKPGLPGYTWNIEKSLFARVNSFKWEPSRRLDRILVRSDVWKPQEVYLLGDEPYVPGDRDRFPSDHFGVAAVLKKSGAALKE